MTHFVHDRDTGLAVKAIDIKEKSASTLRTTRNINEQIQVHYRIHSSPD
jgi:hypothetical protein